MPAFAWHLGVAMGVLFSVGVVSQESDAAGGDKGHEAMIDVHMLTREWVEIREEGGPERLLFRPTSYKIPPARGRRRLDLREPGQAVAKTPGPTDRLQSSAGAWSLEGDELRVSAPGWEGAYRIEELTEDKLVLRPK